MKRFFALLILLNGIRLQHVFAQNLTATSTRQPYYLEKAPDAPGVYMQTAYKISGVPSADKTKTIQIIDVIVEVIKKAYPQPVGAHVGIYSGIFENYIGLSEFKNGPYRTYITVPFYDLYKTKSGSIEASGEYASSIQIWVNNVDYILQANSVQNGNKKVYRIPKPGIAVNGFPKYNNMVLIIPPGRSLPWRPATKQQYLENVIVSLKDHSGSRQYIADAEQLIASMSPTEKKQIAYIRKAKYSNAQNGFSDFGIKWSGFSNASDTTAEQLVIIDENFYDKTLPRNSFQVIAIERRSVSKAGSTPEQTEEYNTRQERMNSIVRSKEFLPGLQDLLGENGLAIAGKQKKKTTDKKYVLPKINTAYIDRIVDSMFRNYRSKLPSVPAVVSSSEKNNSSRPDLPQRNEKKILLASKQLETKEELVNYLNELDKTISSVTGDIHVPASDNAATNNTTSYGYWLVNKPKEALVQAIKAAKQQPDHNYILNNLGSTLSICGIDYFAVPLYIVCLKKEPGNSTIANNLGQSWLALGDIQKAEQYLKQALTANPYHHHANNSLGLIYESQGRKNEAIKCYQNSLRGSFTLNAIHGLHRLDHEKTRKLMDYIRHRYKQPDYLNFDRYPSPLQCTSLEQTEKRKEEHKAYQKVLDDQIKKYVKLESAQKPIAEKSLRDLFVPGKRPKIKPFLAFADAVIASAMNELHDKVTQLDKELKEIEMRRVHLELEYDTMIKAMMKSFLPRIEAMGEGHVDLTVEEEECKAYTDITNSYLPHFAELNELRYTKIIHAYKDFLNDYLYWIRIASFTKEAYEEQYYYTVLIMLRLLTEVRLTVLDHWSVLDCRNKEDATAAEPGIEIKTPDCPFPIGIEIPFVIGKVSLDCESWGIEAGEGIVVNIDHKIGAETTIAFGAGETFYTTPKIGKKAFDLKPGVDVGAKGQLFITFDGNTVQDGGFLWEAEIDIKGLGKPVEARQNFVFAINKGFNADGILTQQIDKLLDIPPAKQINKNVKIYKPPN